MAYELICPPKAETLATGFIGGAYKVYRGAKYCAELYPAGWNLTKDGERLRSWDDLPKAVQKAALDAKRILLSTTS